MARHRDQAERVAVGRRPRELDRADVAAGAALVVDHHRLAEGSRELVGDQAAHRVGAAARRERHDPADRLARARRAARARRRAPSKAAARSVRLFMAFRYPFVGFICSLGARDSSRASVPVSRMIRATGVQRPQRSTLFPMNSPEEHGSPIRALLALPDFLRLWLVGAFANAMRWLELLASGLFAYEVTGSALAVTAVVAARQLPQLSLRRLRRRGLRGGQPQADRHAGAGRPGLRLDRAGDASPPPAISRCGMWRSATSCRARCGRPRCRRGGAWWARSRARIASCPAIALDSATNRPPRA